MKHLKFLLILLIFTACASTQTTAQIKKYVSYTVKSGETLKSIAADNGISKRDLKRLNPDVRNKPRANTVIIIPKKLGTTTKQPVDAVNTHTVQKSETLFGIAKKYGVSVADLQRENNLTSTDLSLGLKLRIPTTNQKGFITYVAKPKETKYGIAKKFGTTIAILEKHNPSIVKGLNAGQQIRIPSKGGNDQPLEENETKQYSSHTIAHGETFYSLTNQYQISKKDLIALNPSAKFGLKEGMVLKLPKLDAVESVNETIEMKGELVDAFSIDRPLQVAILLPFNLQKSASATTDFAKKTSLLNVTTDFYLGALMAIDSLRKQGLEINYRAFDTQNNASRIDAIVRQNNIEDADVVIGPLYFDKAYSLSKKLRKTMVVAPMYSKKQATANNIRLVKAGVDKKMYKKALLNYMKQHYNGQQIVLVGDASPATASKILNITAILKQHDSISEIKIIKEENGYIGKERFAEVISDSAENWVLFVGKNKVITADAITNIGVLSQTRKVRLFAIENNKFFRNSDNNHLAKMQFTFAQEILADVTKPNVKQFFKKYKAKNYDVPTPNAIKGFDLTYDTLVRIAGFKSLKDGLVAGVSKRIGSKFDYQKRLFGGFENNGVQIIQYNKNLFPIVLE